MAGTRVPGSSRVNPALVGATQSTGERFLSSPGDLLLRPQALGFQGSPHWTLETWFQKFQCLVFRQIATGVCPDVLGKVVKTRWIMVSQVYVSARDWQLNVTLLLNAVRWWTNEKLTEGFTGVRDKNESLTLFTSTFSIQTHFVSTTQRAQL